LRRAPWILFVLPTLAFTECEHFRTVVVPPVDGTPPQQWHRVFVDDVETLQAHPQIEVEADTWFAIYPALQDPGGVASLFLHEILTVKCVHTVSGASYYVDYPLPDYADAQSGGVGSSVQDGLWAAGSVSNLGEYVDACTTGYRTDLVLYAWYLGGSDFHGNEVQGWGYPTGMVTLHP
jgi:hypothetical protein